MRPAILSYLYAKKYGGKFILRFEDTDPRIKKPMEGVEKIYLDDLSWVGCPPDSIVYQSARLDIYFDYALQLVEMGNAFVCTCEDKEEVREKKIKKKACPCRELDIEEQKIRWKKMMDHTFKEGQAVLRIKTDLDVEDPAERDWIAARIIDNPEHYRVKNVHVWPMFNFANAIDDHLMGITLIIRGQQHSSNVKKQKWIYTHFGWTYPHSFHHGKQTVKGFDMSKSDMLEGLKTGRISGWDDPRLLTVGALRRKGFSPHAIVDMMIDLGVKTSDTEMSLELMGTYNRPYIQNAPSIPFIQDPLSLETDFVPALHVNVDGREYDLKAGTQSFLVNKTDASHWKVGTTLRLRNAYIVKVNHADEYKINAQFVSTAKLENTTQTNWLPGGVDVRITMPTNTFVYGIADDALSSVNEGEEVHLPGFGYCRVDEKTEKEIRLWFTHP
jgi:glutamyl-tRNA synthetase